MGVPLGYHTNSSVTQQDADELRQRVVIILGIKSATGDLSSEEGEQRIISEILRQGKIPNFQADLYSEVAAQKPLHYFKVEGGMLPCQ